MKCPVSERWVDRGAICLLLISAVWVLTVAPYSCVYEVGYEYRASMTALRVVEGRMAASVRAASGR